MKGIYKFILAFCVAAVATGCIGKFEEYNRHPYQPPTVPVNNLLVSMFEIYASPQQNSCQFNNCMWACYSGHITSPHNWNRGTEIFAYFNPRSDWNQATTNEFFTKIYSSHFIIEQSTGGEGVIYAIAQLTRIHAMQQVATMQGPLPYTQVKAGETQVPYDDEETAWKAMFSDLDKVIVTLKNAAASGVSEDLAEVDQIYNGDCAKWLKFANTLKLRMAIRISGVDPVYAQTKAEEAVADGVLTSVSESAYDNTNSGQTNNGYKIVHSWGELRANACLVSYMNGYNDPRRAAYFSEATVYGANSQYVGVRSGTQTPPAQNYGDYSSFRIATAVPEGGKDAGENPQPIMYASEAAFLRAEGALKGWAMGGSVSELYNEGIRLSFEEFKVAGVEAYLADNTSTPGDHVDPRNSADNYTNKSEVTIAWDPSASDEVKLEKILTQKWIANLLNPIEGWADFRRTGYPQIFPPVMSASQDGCTLERQMRRLKFPQTEYEGNEANTTAAAAFLNGGVDSHNADLWWAKKSNGQY